MKSPSILKELLKLLGAILLGIFIWVWIFASLPGGGVEESEFFPGATTVLGIATAFVMLLGVRFNTLQRNRQHVKAALSNITVSQEKAQSLLEKANRVADKYMGHEERIHLGVAHSRDIRSSGQFRALLEGYPDLKANASILELLRQIQECENAISYQKVAYNRAVEEYNGMLCSFPGNLLKRLCRLEEMQFYTKPLESEMISDEELGI